MVKDIYQIWPNLLLVNQAVCLLQNLTIDLDNDLVDIIPVGSWEITNPDFVERIKNNTPLNETDHNPFLRK